MENPASPEWCRSSRNHCRWVTGYQPRL